MPVTNGDFVFPCYGASSFACIGLSWKYLRGIIRADICMFWLCAYAWLMSDEPISDLGELVHC